ncbi:polar amino acid transport system permease protein [Polaromonas sp. OV174]|uniref:amino acid ABC transporter permease n=1 Tax=Polaromonas sp. OV174 TaxID=1855300 RepID=UPI0008EF7812|nr:amino acid ABC transporter permease [Polaromonas sp. OV174]SFC72539.1 polar amino acid transport system permease protein [Polaromonas sp. OV174]
MLDIIQTYWLQLLIGLYPHGPLGGLVMTLILAVSGLLLALPAGMVLALTLIAPWRWLNRLAQLFVFYMRSVPLLVHLLWAYFLVPLLLGPRAPLMLSVIVTLTLFNGAYMSQVIVAGIQALPRGQYEAARALGLGNGAALRLVIVPQALRNVTPSIITQLVLLIKETSLASLIGVHEISEEFMGLNDLLGNRSAEIFILLGLSYFILCYPLTLFGRRLERRFAGANGIIKAETTA